MNVIPPRRALGFALLRHYYFPMKPVLPPTAAEDVDRKLAEADGIDLSLIEDALLKSPEDRLLDNSRALATIEALRTAWKEQHGGA